jgi:uncharacterized membrane protein
MSKKSPGCVLIILGVVSLLSAIWFYIKQLLLDPKQASSADRNWAIGFLILGIIGIVAGLSVLRKRR